MKKLKIFILGSMLLILTGCGTTIRTSPTYSETIKETKTIAVMPPDIKVLEISAGGVPEVMDEWSDQAKKNIVESLKKHFADRYHLEVKFIEEKWLKENYKDIWRDNRSLYDAISSSAIIHAFPGGYGSFPDKIKTFDYSMGTEIKQLSDLCGTDALLFIWGYDTERSAGRFAVEFLYALAFGVYYVEPSAMTMGLVNSKTGNLEWLSLSPAGQEYSFRNSKNLDGLVEWMTRNYLPQK